MPAAEQMQEESSHPGTSLRAWRQLCCHPLSLVQFCGREKGHLIRTLPGDARLFGCDSGRRFLEKRRPAESGRLRLLLLQEDCKVSGVPLSTSYQSGSRVPILRPFPSGIKEEGQARTTCGPPARDATSLEGLGPWTGLNALVTRSAAGPSASTCHPADMLPWCLFPVRRCRETRLGRHFPLHLQAQDRVCRLAGLRHLMTRNRITGGKQQCP